MSIQIYVFSKWHDIFFGAKHAQNVNLFGKTRLTLTTGPLNMQDILTQNNHSTNVIKPVFIG